jgi:hypothetical protein
MTTVLASFIVFITKNLYQIFVLHLRCGGNDANIFSNCGKIYNSSTETCMCIRKHRIHWGSDTMMLSRTQLLLSWLSRVSIVALRAFFPLSSSSHSLAASCRFLPSSPSSSHSLAASCSMWGSSECSPFHTHDHPIELQKLISYTA